MFLNLCGKGNVGTKNAGRRAILEHRGEFSRRLTNVERYNDDPLGHQGEIKRHPEKTVRCKQCAAIVFPEALRSEELARLSDPRQKIGARETYALRTSDFLQNGLLAGALSRSKIFSRNVIQSSLYPE